jgi:two-component sensor histidine kinase
MQAFVNTLLKQLLQCYMVRDMKIAPVINVTDYPFPISIAVPVGLIINELLTNVLKHAFVGRAEGVVEISIAAPESGKIRLTVSDDGVGLPDEFDINATKPFGLRLVRRLGCVWYGSWWKISCTGLCRSSVVQGRVRISRSNLTWMMSENPILS